MSRGGRVALVIAGALVAACGASGGGDGPDADPFAPDADPTAPDADPTTPDGGTCGALAVAPPWLDGTLRDTVARLSGASDITPGVRLADRATPARRTTARDWIEAQLDGLGLSAAQHDYTMGKNVWARLPGSDPSAGWLVLGAHFDSVGDSPGANDNASGVAAVLASARLLRDTCRRAGIIVVLLDQEEIGLVGATQFAAKLAQDGEDVIAVHTIDQLAWDQDGDAIYEIELPAAGLFAQYQAAASALGLGVRQTSTSSTDHQAFRDRGFAAVGVTEEYVGGDTTDCYHLPCDVYADVDFDYAADGVALITRVLAAAAQ